MKTIAVIGATGKQGGAVARHLAGNGWRVRAITRKANAQVPGAEVAVADQNDPASLDRAFDGVHGVFSVQPAPHDPKAPGGYDFATETRWGRNVAEAAARAGAHLVYSSLAEAAQQTGVASFDSKWAVERRIAELGVTSTILRPATFMDGLYHEGMTKLTHVLDPDTKYQLIAVDDIGAIAAKVFADPVDDLAIAGDELTPKEIAAEIGVGYERFHVDDPELAKVFQQRAVPRADIARLRELHSGLRTFPAFLSEVRGSVG